jgi:hypothetical protein
VQAANVIRRGAPFAEDPVLGRRFLAALVDVHAALTGDSTFEAFAAALPDLPEAEDNWYIATKVAAEARVDDTVGRAVSFLLGERSTSFAKASPIALALAIAAAESYGVAENCVADSSPQPVMDAARRPARAHAERFDSSSKRRDS